MAAQAPRASRLSGHASVNGCYRRKLRYLESAPLAGTMGSALAEAKIRRESCLDV